MFDFPKKVTRFWIICFVSFHFSDAMPGSHSVPLSRAVAASSPLSRDLRVAMIDSNAKLPNAQNVDTNAIPDQRVSSITPATVRFFKGVSLPRFSLGWLGLDSERDVVVDISWINENHASIHVTCSVSKVLISAEKEGYLHVLNRSDLVTVQY